MQAGMMQTQDSTETIATGLNRDAALPGPDLRVNLYEQVMSHN